MSWPLSFPLSFVVLRSTGFPKQKGFANSVPESFPEIHERHIRWLGLPEVLLIELGCCKGDICIGPLGILSPSSPCYPVSIQLTFVLQDALFALFQCDALSGPVRETPPYRAIPFRDSIAEGGIAPICLVFMWYRASIAEIPLLWGGGYRTSTSHALQGGYFQKKRRRGYRTQLAMLSHQKPHSAK